MLIYNHILCVFVEINSHHSLICKVKIADLLGTKGPTKIVNVKRNVQNILLGGGGKKNVDSVHFQNFSQYVIIFMAKIPFKKC